MSARDGSGPRSRKSSRSADARPPSKGKKSPARGGGGRRKTPAKPPPKRGRRLLKWLIGLALFGLLAAAGVLVGGYWYFARGLPDFEKIEDWQPPQVTRVRAADGTIIAELFRERRTVVPLAAIPPVLVNAVLSAEDADFYRHEGLDYPGMLRALLNSLQAGRITGGGSTITQQTVKNLLLTPEKRFERKARELILARRLEDRLSKDGILAIYLNMLYLGHGRYGVAEAARFYFGHDDLADITLPQAATLAGLIQSPERLSPVKHPARAAERRDFVLRMMVKNGHITEAEADAARAADLGLVDERPDPFPREAQWYVDSVRAQLFAAYGEEAVVTGGLDVRTALDLDRQRAALAALRDGLRAVDARHGYGKAKAKVAEGEVAAWRAKRVKKLDGKPPRPGVPVLGRVSAIEPDHLIVDLGVGEAAVDRDALDRFADRENPLASPFGEGDVITVAVRADGPAHPERMSAVPAGVPQGAVVVVDPGSRHVLALAGGWDSKAYPFDRATQARRQPGSAFKPFVWGAALASKRYTAASTLIDAPETLRVHKGRFWQPKNYTRTFRGAISLRTALAHSINSVAVALAEDVGVPAVQEFARAAGITSPLADGLAMALGASEVPPLELANAFATVAADGRMLPPRFILSVEGPGDPAPIEAPEPVQAIDPAVAHILRSLMRSTVTDGTGKGLADFERPVAGKTGTSNEARDAWFVALLPEVVVTAWVGFDTPRPLGRKETGGGTALPIVEHYLRAMEAEGPDWPPPPEGVEVRRVVDDGRLAPPGGEEGREELFLTGTAPTEVAPAAGEVDAQSFFFEEVGARPAELPAGPSLAVPSVDVAPLPPTLRPIAPVPAEPAPGDDGEDDDDDDGDSDDDGPKLRPIAPLGGGEDDPEDLPP